jgi:hypothetical protein
MCFLSSAASSVVAGVRSARSEYCGAPYSFMTCRQCTKHMSQNYD